jgi:hypothetical protein
MLEKRRRSVARAYSKGLNFECPRDAGKQHFDLSLSDLDAPKPPLQHCAQKTSKFLSSIFEFWPTKQAICPTVHHPTAPLVRRRFVGERQKKPLVYGVFYTKVWIQDYSTYLRGTQARQLRVQLNERRPVGGEIVDYE